ncbi:uncharacterized protein EI90DRAFT_3024211 [Cantharellus anzutake]|uniref:uncharacterized protein n=1 Tax=Cantharellus anzutake TaxID=1750568 RepID=UPI00190813F0|nr:uncharacterized protein EI90DRAFT_3024211 [Cantharellus anzutake]KAF8310710.1 hypothetical protein EI90DRAFT_3024211 [Cantharellus anzutake]
MEEVVIIVGGIGTTKNKARIHGNKSWARVRGMGDVRWNASPQNKCFCETGDGLIVLGIKGAADVKNTVRNVLEDLHTYGFLSETGWPFVSIIEFHLPSLKLTFLRHPADYARSPRQIQSSIRVNGFRSEGQCFDGAILEHQGRDAKCLGRAGLHMFGRLGGNQQDMNTRKGRSWQGSRS